MKRTSFILLGVWMVIVCYGGIYTPVAPLLGNTIWDQKYPYNGLCPTLNGVKCPTGCVTTAVAQIMSRHKYPAQGIGSIKYLWNNNSTPVSPNYLECDFSQSHYDWDNILPSYKSGTETTAQLNAIRVLMHDVGYACEMDYSTNGSNVYERNVPKALIEHFGYDKGLTVHILDYYSSYYDTEEGLLELIQEELLAGRPIFITGYSTSGNSGHAFLCDGINADGLLHINFGWGGTANDYYPLTDIKPTVGGTGAGERDYTKKMVFLTNIEPSKGTIDYAQSIGIDGDFTTIQQGFLRSENAPLTNDITYIFNYGYKPWEAHFGYNIYKGNTLQYSCPATLGTTGTITAGRNIDVMEGFSISKTSIISTTPHELSQNLPIGCYDIVLSAQRSGTSTTYDPIHFKNRGICKHKLIVTPDSIYIYPLSTTFTRSNTPTDFQGLPNSDGSVELSWQGKSNKYCICIWNGTTLKTYSSNIPSIVVSEQGEMQCAIFGIDDTTTPIQATTEILYGSFIGSSAPTGVEQLNVPYSGVTTQKVLHNGHILIVREGKYYTLSGQQVN